MGITPGGGRFTLNLMVPHLLRPLRPKFCINILTFFFLIELPHSTEHTSVPISTICSSIEVKVMMRTFSGLTCGIQVKPKERIQLEPSSEACCAFTYVSLLSSFPTLLPSSHNRVTGCPNIEIIKLYHLTSEERKVFICSMAESSSCL